MGRVKDAALFIKAVYSLTRGSQRRLLLVHRLNFFSSVAQLTLRALAFGHHEDRTPTHGYATSREAAMTAFAKGWRRE